MHNDITISTGCIRAIGTQSLVAMSLFKRPVWAKQQVSDDNDEDRPEANIFSHSHSYQDIVAEQEKRKREKAEKKKAKAERRISGKREIKNEADRDSSPKRRRITQEESEKLLRSVGLPAEQKISDNDEPAVEYIPVRRSARKLKDHERTMQSPKPATVIELGGSSDEDGNEHLQTTPGASRRKPIARVEEIEDDSDDEFAELARKARQQRQQGNNCVANVPKSGTIASNPGRDTSHPVDHDRPPDPVIELFITSPLAGTDPLIVHRKLSQPTGAIRHAWCQKQGFTKDFSDGVFFIHRLRRVYDVTTCRSLGLEVDEYGNVTMRGAEGKEGVEKVHLEAVTEEVFRRMKEAKDKDPQGRNGLGHDEEEEEHVAEPAKQESVVRLVLKAKGQKDFRLKVKPVSCVHQAQFILPALTSWTEHANIQDCFRVCQK